MSGPEQWRRLVAANPQGLSFLQSEYNDALRTAADTVDRLRERVAELEKERALVNDNLRRLGNHELADMVQAADELAKAQARIATLEAVEKAARELRDNAEEYDCEGLGLFAQHGYWQPLHDALDEIDDRAAAALGENDE